MKTVQQRLDEANERFIRENTKYKVIGPVQSTGAQFHGPLVTFSAPLPSQETIVNAMTADATSRAQQQSEPTDQELDALLALTPTGRAIIAERVAAHQEAAPDTSNQRTPEYEAALNTALAAMSENITKTQWQIDALKAQTAVDKHLAQQAQEARESAPEVVDSLLATTPVGKQILAERAVSAAPDQATRELLALTSGGRAILSQIDAEQGSK